MILLYSGGCPVCRWVVRSLLPHLDTHGTLDILPFRHPVARTMLRRFGLRDINIIKQHWWFIDKNGQLWRGDQGGAKQVLMSFRRTRWWARLIPSKVLDWVDDWVNHHRPLIAPHLEDGPAMVRLLGRTEWHSGDWY